MFVRVIAAAALAIVPIMASASTIVDGSFEAAGTGIADYCYDGLPYGSGPCPAGAWGNAAGVIRSGSGAWGGTTAADGDYYGMLQGGQVLSQTFVAAETAGLMLNWADANRTNNGGAHSYTVTVNGATVGTYTSGFGGFVAKSSAKFGVVSGQSYTVAYNGIVDGDTTSFIDSVSLATVPEPASWALLITGFGFVGLARRRRNKRVGVNFA
uniref:PEPxxWA-CTERM sorting domain-containing protein n=1 Tax=Sphingomonas sp. TaxID=28214 RepID=UPI0025F4C73D|nr:PEPxxWA-CTERM sorting domain-containing protein [Sphingomonas sp.]